MADSGNQWARLARNLRPVLVAVLAVSLIVVVVLGMRVQTALRELEDQPTDNLHWNLVQLELDLVRFNEELRVVSANGAANLTELRRRYDLFYSRAQNAIGGKGYTAPGLEARAEAMVQQLGAFLARQTPRIDSGDAALRAALPVLLSEAEDARLALRQSTIEMISDLAVLNDDRRQAFSILVQRMALALAATVAILVSLLGIVVWLNRDAAREARATARLSERLAATVNSALDAIIVADAQGRVLQYNPSAERIFGFRRDEIIGQDLACMIIPERDRGAHHAGLKRVQQGGDHHVVGAGRFETSALNRDGREFPVELAISRAEGDAGVIYIAFLRDITKRIAAQTALTAARDEALAAERAKTNFLAVMSHEMRTPLNGVIASLEIAAQQASDAKQARFIDLARNSASQLLRHANDVLDITRMESGGLKLADEDFDLGEHLSGLVEAIRPICRDKGIALDLTILGALPPLHGDPFRLGQIVQNYLSNAIKFVQQGAITVEAEVSASHGDRREVEIRVIDTGPGIPEADQDRIFDDFVMLDPSFGRSGGGAGLGLAICRRLARAIGGEVGVESTPGEGSCFWVRATLPLARAHPMAAPAQAEAADLPAQDVLVVEDNATNRAVLEEMLLRLGQRVTMRNDGKSGAEEAQARRYDLILMDISMPVMDGLSATRLIRAEGASRDSRILAVTAHSMPADLERFRAAGMDDTLVKPISLAALRTALSGRAQPAPDQGDALLDPERIADLRLALGAQGTARIKAGFLTDASALKDRILAAIDQGMAQDAMIALCHEAAGVASVFGAVRLRHHYATAEALCRDGHMTEARGLLVRDTETLWQATRAAIEAEGQ